MVESGQLAAGVGLGEEQRARSSKVVTASAPAAKRCAGSSASEVDQGVGEPAGRRLPAVHVSR